MELYPYAPVLEKALNERSDDSTQYIVRHRGMPGWTSSNMLGDLDGERTGLRTAVRAVKDPGLSLVIILAGSNDLGWGFGEEEIVGNLVSLHEVCYENGVPRTIAVAIPPSGYQSQNAAARELCATVNDRLRSYCSQEHRATFVPFPFAYDGGENWFSDGLHFSEKGYRALGESLAEPVIGVLESLDKEG
jgi:lysophospholipase L1-like esterase